MPDAVSATSDMAGHAFPKIWLVGGGIASMAAAAFMIRDGDVPGHDITILEESCEVGGSLDAAGTPEGDYVLRGGRMLESKYLCTFALCDSIPTLNGEKTVTQEILDFNTRLKTSSKARLFHDGERQITPEFGLSERHILTIERLAVEPVEPPFGSAAPAAMSCSAVVWEVGGRGTRPSAMPGPRPASSGWKTGSWSGPPWREPPSCQKAQQRLRRRQRGGRILACH